LTGAQHLCGFEEDAQVVEVSETPGPGNALWVELVCEHVTELFVGFGERGVRAELVAERVTREVRQYLAAGVPVGPHLADQLLAPLALAGGGRFRTLPLSPHGETNLEVIQQFLPLRAQCSPVPGGVEVELRSAR
jgi:RNA 3'-terminal phosphate cyclase (ATP)